MSQTASAKDRNRDYYHRKQIRIMHQLKDRMPHYGDILCTYEQVLREREKYRTRLYASIEPKTPEETVIYQSRLENGIPLLDKNDIEFDHRLMSEHLVRLVRIFKAESQNRTACLPDSLLKKEKVSLNTFINRCSLDGQAAGNSELMTFLVSETIHPVLELYTEQIKDRVDFASWDRGYCPVCGEFPTMAALSSDTGKRTLISTACRTEWTFPRVKCPYCGNEDQHQLSYFFIESEERYRVETCDRCGHYIKTIDLRKTNQAMDYEIENIITLHLDVIARDKGYSNDDPGSTNHPVNLPAGAVYH